MAQSLHDTISPSNKLSNSIERGSVSRFLSPAHAEVYMREKLPCMRGKLCPHMAQGAACSRRDDCHYSHNLSEVRMYNLNFKTKLCSFAINGECKKADSCRYAHSLEELAPDMESPSISKGTVVGRNISTVSTDPDTTPKMFQDVCSKSGLLDLPSSPRYASQYNVSSPIVVPPSSHYVDQLSRQPKYIVPRNVRISKESIATVTPPYYASPPMVHSGHMFYNPSLGIYQPIPMDMVPYREVYED